MPEGPDQGPEYWDRPDPLLPPHEDPFCLFVRNEAFLYRMQERGHAQEYIDRARRGMDAAYVEHRRGLREQWLSYAPEVRRARWFLRLHLPQIQFWPEGDCLDSNHPR
jgi:hypothetical protein